jgi:hypothetical protein
VEKLRPELSVIPAHQNPFRTSRILELPAHWGDTTPEALLARWHATGRRGALVGPHGTGKTTRLRALAARLADEGWRVVWVQWHDNGTTTPADWSAVLRDVDARTVICLDGSENLGPLAAYRLHRYTRRAGGLLATRHRASPFLKTLAHHRPDAEAFAAHAALLAPGMEQMARKVFLASRGDAHEAFRRLYLSCHR